MFLFDKEFERKFNAEFSRLHPHLSQAECYGVSFKCASGGNCEPRPSHQRPASAIVRLPLKGQSHDGLATQGSGLGAREEDEGASRARTVKSSQGLDFTCPTQRPRLHEDRREIAAELRHMEYLSYRMAPLWSGWNDATDAETRLLYLFRLAYMFTEGLWCVSGAGQIIEWGGCGIILADLESMCDDVVREINWLLNEHRTDIRLLKLNEQEAQKLAGVQYTWQYQHWVDIEDDHR